MTPERIEDIRSMMEEEYERPCEPFSSAFMTEAPHAIADLLAALEESQQRIGKLELYVKSLEFNREDTQKRANEKLRERDTELVEAQQTIANVKGILERPKLPIFNADGSFSWESHHKMMKKSLEVAIGVSEWEPVGNKEGSDKS